MTRMNAALVSLLLSCAVSARAADVKAPVVPELGGPLAVPQVGAPQTPGLEIPSLPPSVITGPVAPLSSVAPGAAQTASPIQAAVRAAEPAQPVGEAVQSGAAAAKAEQPSAPGQISARLTAENLAAKASAAQPGSDSAAGASAAAFDGTREHDEVSRFHSFHRQHEPQAPAVDLSRRQPPVQIPDRLKALLPSAQDPATWTGLITLHLHTVYSDGTMEPENLVQLAYDKGVRELAVSEHDTTASTLRAWNKAKELGVKYHTAVEFTAAGGAHIGGVDIDIAHPKVVSLLSRVHEARYLRAQDAVEYLNGPKILDDLEQQSQQPEERWQTGEDGQSSKVVLPAGRNSASEALRRLKDFRGRGGRIKLEDVVAQSRHNEGGTIEFPHIARVLLANGLIDNVDQAFDAFLKGAMGGRSTAPPDPSPEEVIDVIHSAGGKAILNHPYTVRGRNPSEQADNVNKILDAGIDGLEIYRPSHATSQNGKRKADERAAGYLELAEQRDLFAAPGADFHGTDTHLDTLVVWMPKTLAAQLQERLKDANAAAISRLEELDRAQKAPPSPRSGSAAALLAAPLALGAQPFSLDQIPLAAFVPPVLLGLLFGVAMSGWFKRFERRHKLAADLLLFAIAVGFAGSAFAIISRGLGL